MFAISILDSDESNFRSGEVAPKRWTIEGKTPFLSKGQGRSYMVSDFLVAHSSGPFFSLSQEEFDLVTKQYRSLNSDSNDLNFVNFSATAGINVGQDGYFDSDTILYQFERLFQLLSYKKDFKDHEIEIIVNNARTHSAKEYSTNDFSKGIGTKCPVSAIEYVDDQNQDVSISCYFANGEHRGKSKGLLMLAKDLSISVDPPVKLAELRTILTSHAAFQKVSRLENLARKYNIKVIFAPKFHCELNAIEGLWCYMKQYVHKNSDQTYRVFVKHANTTKVKVAQLYLYRQIELDELCSRTSANTYFV